jgi:hypothetical protein
MTQEIRFNEKAEVKVENLHYKKDNVIEIEVDGIKLVLPAVVADELFQKLEIEMYDESEWHSTLDSKVQELERRLEEIESNLEYLEAI